MPLVRRVSLFFLGALAVCLIGYSLMLYGLVRHTLTQQFQQERQAALNTLAAAVEVEDDDVKWQPDDHAAVLSGAVSQNHLRWIVINDAGHLVDHSRNVIPAPSDGTGATALLPMGEAPPWEVVSQRLSASHPKSAEEREPGDFAALTVMVATSSAPLQATLSRLAITLAGLSLLVWLIAAGLGFWYCRRALWPLMQMLAEVRSTTEADFHLRLPVSRSHDELSELATAFNRLLNRLQEAFDRQRHFAGNAAHQMRTPLTVMRGQLEVGLRRERSAEDYRTTMQTVHDQTVGLQQMVESLLLLAQPGETIPQSLVEAHPLKPWFMTALNHWQSHPRWSDLRIEIDEHLTLRTAWPLLAQVINILIENAFKYSPPASSVVVAAHQAADETTISVSDHGAGIAREDQAAVFDPFYRSASARSSGTTGVGLGLALAAHITRVLGGQIVLSSECGRGTTFTLHLPRGGPDAADHG